MMQFKNNSSIVIWNSQSGNSRGRELLEFPLEFPEFKSVTAAVQVRRATINEGAFMSMPMSMHLEMGVVREREASLNRSGIECGIREVEMRNGMCRKVLQSGAALKAIVRGESIRTGRRCTV
jgi:hypothetical protein